MKIILIRHAESAANVRPQLYRTMLHSEIPLTRVGESQAQWLGPAVTKEITAEEVANTTIYFSPYVRTTKTKDLMLQSCTYSFKNIKLDPLIIEQSRGNTLEQIAVLQGGDYPDFWYKELGAESYADVHYRARLKLQEIRTTHKQDDVVVLISHLNFLQAFEALLTDSNPMTAIKDIKYSNAQIKQFEI